MAKIESISSGNFHAPIDSGVSANKQNNNLYEEKLTFTPAELKLKGKPPGTIVLSEKQIETKLFEKYGFKPNDPLQMEMLKLRFDTKRSPYAEINWGKGQFVARQNSAGQYEITVGLRGRTVEALQGRLISTPTGSGGVNPNNAVAANRGIDNSSQRAVLQAKANALSTEGFTPEQKELIADLAQVGLSVVGIFDPTGIADGADAIISLGRGDYWGAGISALGIIPYLGDLAKIGKLPKLLKVVENVVSMAKTDAKFAKVVKPLLSKLKGALDSLPINKLPDWAKKPIESLKNKIDEFFSLAKKIERTEPSLPPNPNRLPEGNPKKTNPKDKRPENIRATTRENESAKLLAEQGYKVRQLPDATKGKVQGVKKPDFEIEGRVFDNYAPSTGNARNIAKVLEEKLGETQAERFVLNLSDSKVSLEVLKKQLQDFPIAGLKEIIIIKDGKVNRFFPFNK